MLSDSDHCVCSIPSRRCSLQSGSCQVAVRRGDIGGVQAVYVIIRTTREYVVLHNEISGTVVKVGDARVVLQTGAAVVADAWSLWCGFFRIGQRVRLELVSAGSG